MVLSINNWVERVELQHENIAVKMYTKPIESV